MREKKRKTRQEHVNILRISGKGSEMRKAPSSHSGSGEVLAKRQKSRKLARAAWLILV